MGYFFQNVTDLASFLVSQSKTGRNASPLAENGFTDFGSTMEAVSISSNEDTAGIENTLGQFLAHGAGETEADAITTYKTAEPAELDHRMVSLLLSKSESKVSVEISSDDLALLLNNHGAGKPVPPRLLEPLNPLHYQAKHRITFLPAGLLSPGNSERISVNLESPGLSAPAKYVSISELVSLIKDYPDPVRMEVSIPLENDPTPNLNASMQDSNIKQKGAFCFDLRQLFKTDNTGNNTIRGIIMLSGKQYSANILEAMEASLLPKPIVAADLPGNNLNSSLLKNSMDLLKTPLNSHRSSLFGFGAGFGIRPAGKLSNPTADLALADSLKGTAYYSTESDNGGAPENRGRLHSNTLNSRLPDEVSGSKNVFNGTLRTKGANVISESISSYAEGETGISKTPTIELTEPRLRPILDTSELRSGILYAARKNLTHVTLKLHPEKLGRVSIRLIWRGDSLSAHLKTANAEAAKILSAGLTELKSGLEYASLKVENLNVILDDDKGAGAFGSSNDARSQKHGAELRDNNPDGNRRFSAVSTDGSRRKNTDKIMQPSTHRGWIDLRV